MKDKPYASLVDSLMYAQVCTRPDIAFAVGILGRYQINPSHEHWVAGKKVLRYLKRTKDYMLVYKRSSELELIGYTDSDYAGCKYDLKSTSGFIFMMAGGAISWKSVKQTCVTTSTMQAEFIALHEAVVHAIWLRNFLVCAKVVDSIERPITIFCDNSAAVFFSNNNKRSSMSKNIDTKYLKVREYVKEEKLQVSYIKTGQQLADPFTKAISVGAFQTHVSNMGLYQDFECVE